MAIKIKKSDGIPICRTIAAAMALAMAHSEAMMT